MTRSSVTRTISVYTLIITNLVPLVGIFFFSWDIFSILFLYWAESLIIGGFHVIKLFYSSLKQKFYAGFFLVPFFCIHFGGFLFGHLVLLLVLFSPIGLLTGGNPGFAELIAVLQTVSFQVFFAFLFLLVSHGVSFVNNYLQKQEYLYKKADDIFFAPYKRIGIMQAVILLSGGFFTLIKGPLLSVILLVALKMFFDLRAHIKAHHISETPL